MDERDEASSSLPHQFKSLRGEAINVVRKGEPTDPALISYSRSKVQGNALLDPGVADLGRLLDEVDTLFEEGLLEEGDGNEVNSLVLPIDAFELSPEARGVIVDCDLRGYSRGLDCLLVPPEDPSAVPLSLAGVLEAVAEFAATMDHLRERGYRWQGSDGRQLFFNGEHGLFRLVWDGTGFAREEESSTEGRRELERAVARAILCLLTGAWPAGVAEDADAAPLPGGVKASWDAGSGSIASATDVEERWRSLPATLRDALQASCFEEAREDGTPVDWKELLSEATRDVERCAYCGADVFRGAPRCLSCGRSTEKCDLLTVWSVRDDDLDGTLRLTFGRGTLAPGAMVGSPPRFKPSMRLVFSAKRNLLGLRNLSSVPWTVTGEGGTSSVAPGKVATIEEGLSIRFDGFPTIEMRFVGYASQEVEG